MSCLPIPFAVLVLALSASAQQLQWTELHSLPPRSYSAVAYDSARERLVLFGGSTPHLLADTWECDGSAWIHRGPSTSPPARRVHAMAYDSARGRVVLFGGSSGVAGSGQLGDTWEWDGTDWTQVNATPAPPARAQSCMAYDSLRQRTVLFGGFNGGGQLGDTWEYDGVAWTPIAPAVSPAARANASMAFDSVRSRTVLYGGYIGTTVPTFPGDTWEWDGTTWVQAVTPIAPTLDVTSSLAFDSLRGRTVLFGGIRQLQSGLSDETWEWDGSAWIHRGPSTSPPARISALMAYDSARGRVVLFGGAGGSNGADHLGDTWEWDGTAWTQSVPEQSPAMGAVPLLLHDHWNGQLLACGRDGWSYSAFETWSWSGRRWTQLHPPLSPTATYQAAASDPLRLTIVLFGGYQGGVRTNETWQWTGTTWLQALPATSPSPRIRHRLAFDHASNRVLLFGGEANPTRFNDTWAFDGTAWTQLAPATSPTGRWGHGLASDPVRQRVVLFGGVTGTLATAGETWEWNGTNWTLVATSGPSARSEMAMDYDPLRQRVVLFGGNSAVTGNDLRDTWAWDGTTWTNLGLVHAPSARSYAGLAWDAQWGHHLLLGGQVATNWPGDAGPDYATWALSSLQESVVVPFGTGCGGPLGAPVHGGDEPYVGNDGFSLEVKNTPANAPCLFGLSTAQQAVSLGSGCTLYLGFTMDSWFTFANGGGVARVRLSIPPSMAFLGATVFTQAAVWDPLGPFGGLSLSAARQLTIGL